MRLDGMNSRQEGSFSWTWDDNAAKLGADAEE
jgi:hypothetical protein